MVRERKGGLYRVSSFYLAKVLVETPNQLLQRVVFYLVIYWMIGLKNNAGSFFIWFGINLLQCTTSVGLGFMIGAASPTIEIASILAPLLNVIFLLFGSSLLPVGELTNQVVERDLD